MGMIWAKEWLEEHNSSVTLDLQLGGVLGGDRETAESAIAGSIDIGACADMTLSPFIPKLAFVNFPGIFKDMDEVKSKLWAGWAGDVFKEESNKGGLEILAFIENGFRRISTNRHAVRETSDFKGMLMRVPEVPFLVDFFQELGCVTTPIGFGELATALQQKVVDGHDNALSAIYPYSLYEFTPWITISNHSYSSAVYFMNLDTWNSLSPKQQQDVKAAYQYGAEKATEYAISQVPDQEKDMIEKADVEIITPSQGMANDFFEIGKKLATGKYLDTLGQDIVSRMYP
jgi:TRAP-type C4-dicarboxylate transport system substrate-binding protein